MEALYHQTNRNLHEAHELFVQLERASSTEGPRLENYFSQKIELILKDLERLDILVPKEPPNRRHNAKIRVDQLKSDIRHLQSSVRNIQSRRWAIEQEEENRQKLLGTKFTTNAAASQNDTSILIDKALEHHDSLGRSNRSLDDLLGHGQTILENLRDQRFMIKGFHKKLLDITSTLGMSNTVMRFIERRTEGDKYIFFGGMAFTTIIIFLILYYFT